MKDLKSKKDIFIEEATRIHGKKFNYSEIEYINTRIKVKIYCNSCKIYFNQTPNNHLNSKFPCPSCLHKRKLEMHLKSNEQWITDFIAKHGNKYDYSLVNCKRWTDNIKIICPKHGIFLQNANSHMQVNGCFKCSIEKSEKSGLAKNKEIYLFYFVKFSCNEKSFLKIGATSQSLDNRLGKISRAVNMKYEILEVKEFSNWKDISNFESLIKSEIKFNHIDLIKFRFDKFKGYTECFNIEHYESIKFLIDKYNLGHQ